MLAIFNRLKYWWRKYRLNTLVFMTNQIKGIKEKKKSECSEIS